MEKRNSPFYFIGVKFLQLEGKSFPSFLFVSLVTKCHYLGGTIRPHFSGEAGRHLTQGTDRVHQGWVTEVLVAELDTEVPKTEAEVFPGGTVSRR